jgi:predicted ATPase/DNA-binding SARP family transcriptional activator
VGVAFDVLGPFQVFAGAADVTPSAPRERALLAMLVMNHGSVVGADRLVEELWPDLPADKGRHVLQVRIAALRRRFDEAGVGPIVTSADPGYRLAVEDPEIDANRFATLVEEARSRSGEPAEAASMLRDALGLWRGDALADVQRCLSLEADAARLDEERRGALEDLAEAELANGQHREWVTALEAMTAEEPFRERRWALLMLALYRSGRQVDALRASQRARDALGETGLEPGPELCALERSISVQDASLGVAAEPVPVARRHNLPIGLTSFVGRSPELREIGELLVGARLVTLTGVGGAGKTRLSLHAAEAAIDQYPDGVRLIELASVRDDRAIPTALTEALGIAPSGTVVDVQQLVDSYLAGRRVLLVFDNCEHLVNGVARVVHRILTTCPFVSVLASSREPLGVPGEVTLEVPPLSLPPGEPTEADDLLAFDSVALFCRRASEADPRFRLTPAVAADVARICRRLDGIPLAIELAAARVRVLSVANIAARLDASIQLLSDGPRTADPRHQTLRAALDWSHELLSPAEQSAFRRLAVFPDWFDLDAAAAVWDTPGDGSADGDGLALMTRLVEKSLVLVDRTGEDTRYRLLQPIREYGAGWLTAARESVLVNRRHCEHYVGHAERWRFELRSLTQTRRLVAERANYLAALEWSWRRGDFESALLLLGLHRGIWLRSGDPQGREWLERVLAAPEPRDHWARAESLAVLAHIIHDSEQHDPAAEEQLLRDGTAMAQRLGDESAQAYIDVVWAELAVAAGKTVEARSLIESALDIYRRLGATSSVGWCHEHLGWVAVAEQDLDRARGHFERAVELGRAGDDDSWLVAHAQAALAPLTVLLGEPERGVRLAEDAIVLARREAEQASVVMALARGAETAILAGRHQRASEVLDELVELLLSMGTRRWLADALEMGALVLEWQGDPAAAAEVLEAGACLRVSSGEQGGGVRALATEVRAGRARLVTALGPATCAEHQARGRDRSPEAAGAELLLRLRS